ncbi:hypothetical protein KIN20_005088 [Parelaphostrongylus tenuis]|uniref:Uncharacterized protein n=1 Tax=Parelaphostrongylus tenuis TaxID=148309 RepID=A0AAD5MHV1_PARTN|nr:hypothetical protein KIN20_005088 [Parelaphostrongylus tenuis]
MTGFEMGQKHKKWQTPKKGAHQLSGVKPSIPPDRTSRSTIAQRPCCILKKCRMMLCHINMAGVLYMRQHYGHYFDFVRAVIRSTLFASIQRLKRPTPYKEQVLWTFVSNHNGSNDG